MLPAASGATIETPADLLGELAPMRVPINQSVLETDMLDDIAGALALSLLREGIEDDMTVLLTEDGPMCNGCSATWEYDGDTTDVKPDTEWHEDNCWVVRVRRFLEEIGQ